ncbi:MAG: hypothetical protein ACK55I_09645, partial [bacterium]
MRAQLREIVRFLGKSPQDALLERPAGRGGGCRLKRNQVRGIAGCAQRRRRREPAAPIASAVSTP